VSGDKSKLPLPYIVSLVLGALSPVPVEPAGVAVCRIILLFPVPVEVPLCNIKLPPSLSVELAVEPEADTVKLFPTVAAVVLLLILIVAFASLAKAKGIFCAI